MITLSTYVNAKKDLKVEIPSTLDALEPYFDHEYYTITRDDINNYIEIKKNDDKSHFNIRIDAITSINLNVKDMISTIRTKNGYLHLFIDSVMIGMQ